MLPRSVIKVSNFINILPILLFAPFWAADIVIDSNILNVRSNNKHRPIFKINRSKN